MSRTKIIYFLSAFVLIIGCFTLNLSYSLFTATAESEPISSTVPVITEEIEISLQNVVVSGNKEYLIKQTLNNKNSIPVSFKLSAFSDSETFEVQSTKYVSESTETNDIYYSYGTIEANKSKDIYLRVANLNQDTNNNATIEFSVETDYATKTINTEEYLSACNINNEEQYNITVSYEGAPYSDNTDTLAYKIIDKQITNFGSTVEINDNITKNITNLSDLFLDKNKKTLPLRIPNGELNVTNLTEVTNIEETDVGLYKTEDDYGFSYYYRGANNYNYVSFAGFIWRIVRINGDGSIRLILDGSLDKVNGVYGNAELSKIDSDGLISFNSTTFGENDNAYVGYMYGEVPSTSYDKAHANIKSSTLKKYIDTFYEQYLQQYQEYLADSIFCGDKTRADGYTNLGFGYDTNNKTFYSAYDRLFNNAVTPTPTLKCADINLIADKTLTEEQLAYSRYTSKIDMNTTTNKGVLINNDLTYPIGLLSADEIIFAGAFKNTVNGEYYLYDARREGKSNQYWWSLTPYYYSGSTHFNFYSDTQSYSLAGNNSGGSSFGVRPVINLRSDLLWAGGDGTSGDGAYTVSLPN